MPGEGENPEALDASGGGTGASSREHEEDEQKMDRYRPELVIGSTKTRGGDDADHLEGAVAEGLLDGTVISPEQKHRSGEENAEKDDEGVEPIFLVVAVRPGLPENKTVVEDEIHP
ncbi:hypothetical protein SDC9_69389 [bioreactor metagenome]|uniref:Uncharacterized protein n=1 Tax=bioreactor metagenome TaxID=1076179 RepID=A0A644Y3K9_9ZZZZ